MGNEKARSTLATSVIDLKSDRFPLKLKRRSKSAPTLYCDFVNSFILLVDITDTIDNRPSLGSAPDFVYKKKVANKMSLYDKRAERTYKLKKKGPSTIGRSGDNDIKVRSLYSLLE